MRYAVVDTGSNTIRMSIYEWDNSTLCELFSEAVFANLAAHIVDNCLTEDGILICCDAIKKHKETAKKYSAELHVFATAAIRNAKNTEDIVAKVRKNTGVSLKILSGEDEAELSFLGAVEDFPVDSGIMADVGGGSSEIIAFSNKTPYAVQSVPIGSLKAYNMFVSGNIPTDKEAQLIKDEIKKHLDKNEKFKDIKSDSLCLVGGGVRASVKISEAILNTKEFSVLNVDALLSQFIDSANTEAILTKLTPERKLTVTPGLAIYSAIGHYFNADKIYISDKGIKEGYVLKYLVH